MRAIAGVSFLRIWVALVALGSACAGSCTPASSREATLIDVFTRSDRVLIRQRPALVREKYERMAEDIYGFFRGSLALFDHDFRVGTWAPRAQSGLWAFSMGDAHIENFGLLESTDGTLTFEANDFDAAEFYPVEWDLRRLTVSLLLAEEIATDTRATSERIHQVASAIVGAYLSELASPTWSEPVTTDMDNVHLHDLFRRGRRDQEDRVELEDLTVVVDGARRIKRGILDEEDPSSSFQDLPELAVASLRTLVHHTYGSEVGDLKDAVREFGGGIASRPRVRLLALVEGPSADLADDFLLEVKELSPGLAPLRAGPVHRFATVEARLDFATAHLLASDNVEPLWRSGNWLGLGVQMRRESEAEKGIKVKRFEDERATPEAVVALGVLLAQKIAHVHARTLQQASRDVLDSLDRATFLASEASVAETCLAQTHEDFETFRAWVASHPVLGPPPLAYDTPSESAAAILFRQTP